MTASKAASDIIDVEPLEAPRRDRSLTRVESGEEDAAAATAPDPSGGGWILVLGIVFALLWVGGGSAYVIGFSGIAGVADLTPVQTAGLGFVLTAPALFILLAALAARQMARFSAHARAVRLAAEGLLEPSRTAGGEAQRLADTVTGEIDRINKGLESALARMGAIEEVLRHHGGAIEDAAESAAGRSKSLIADLRAERDALAELADTLDAKAKSVAEAISEQSNMVARAAELAESAASEGETTLSRASRELLEASETTLSRATEAGRSLESGRDRLSALSDDLTGQRDALDKAYADHRGHLESAAAMLREEQDKIAAALDFHRAELDSLTRVARRGADDLKEAMESGSGAMRAAVDSAVEQAQRLTDEVRSQTREAADLNAADVNRLKEAAERAREASEAARRAMDDQARDLNAQIEKLSESTFEAAARTDAALETRLSEAAKAVERVRAMSEEADEALARRFDASIESWRKRMDEFQSRLETAQTSLDAFPDAARRQLGDLETAVRKGMEALNDAAREAAEDAKEIDFALQARMRQNYELLSDFVLKMGALASGGRPEPRDEPAAEATARERAPDSAPERGWRWRDLVSDLREREAPAPTEPDVGAFDPAHLDADAAEAAAEARRASGIAAMRETVRDRLGETAADLDRKLEQEPSIRREAQSLVDALEPEVSRAAREDDPEVLKTLLAGERGRSYLLASAALGPA